MVQESKSESIATRSKETDSRSIDSRYQTLFEQVNAATFLTTLNGEVIEANMRSCELLGYSWDELGQLSLSDILPASTDWSQLVEEISSKGGINF